MNSSGYEEGVEEKGIEFARKKPECVIKSMEEFSKDRYGVDIMKVEVPVNMAYVAGTRACKGESAYTRDQAKEFFRKGAAVAKKPFIYLSAGVSNDVFSETLDLAAESGTNFSGVLVRPRHVERGHPGLRQAGSQGARRLARGSGRQEHQERERPPGRCKAVVWLLRCSRRPQHSPDAFACLCSLPRC